jgi:hypothetical protein
VYQRNVDGERFGRSLDMSYRLCTEDRTRRNETFTGCMDKASKDSWYLLEHSIENAVGMALIPIPLGWLAIYIVTWIVRWVKSGFSVRAGR